MTDNNLAQTNILLPSQTFSEAGFITEVHLCPFPKDNGLLELGREGWTSPVQQKYFYILLQR